MATCPRCKGHLTDSHRCPRHPFRTAAELIVAAVVGGFVGLLLVALVDPQGAPLSTDAVAAATGAVLGIGLQRALRG